MRNHLIAFAILLLLGYLVGWYIEWHPNPARWSDHVRALTAGLPTVFFIVLTLTSNETQ